GQLVDAPRERAQQPVVRRRRGRKVARELHRQLQQRERVACRGRQQPCLVGRRDRRWAARQQLACGVLGQGAEREPVERLEGRRGACAQRDQKGDLLADQPPGREGERL